MSSGCRLAGALYASNSPTSPGHGFIHITTMALTDGDLGGAGSVPVVSSARFW